MSWVVSGGFVQSFRAWASFAVLWQLAIFLVLVGYELGLHHL